MKVNIDVTGVNAVLDDLLGETRYMLARSMALAGARVFQEEARARAPVDSGVLRDSIRAAYSEKRSSNDVVVYTVRWSQKTAKHGHLLEQGHWRVNAGFFNPAGVWVPLKKKLVTRQWVAAKPHLRPAFDAVREKAQEAMIERGKERLPELVQMQAQGNTAYATKKYSKTKRRGRK